MRCAFLAAVTAALATRAAAQGADSAHVLAADVAGEAAYRYNLPAALRTQGATTVEAGRTVEGNLAVRDGALTIAGTVRGSVIVINGSVHLLAGARVDSNVVVVGGSVRQESGAAVGGQVRAYAASLPYRMQGDAMVATADTAAGEWGWFKRWQTRYDSAQTKFALRAGTYDRVEGLPVMAGLALRRNWAIGQVSFTGLGIYRSVNGFEWTPDNLGYDVTAELRRGRERERSLTFGARFFDIVSPVEDWQLSNTEISLFSFVVRQDQRDYYNAQGGTAWATARRGATSVTLRYSQSSWADRAAQNPVSIFHTSNPWRANPVLDEGLVRRVNGGVVYDTRNDAADPWTGWLLSVDAEIGWSSALVLGPTSPIARPATPSPAAVTYGRGWLDLRRYDRISPEGHLNVRLVYGTELGGAELPLERRFSMGGPGSLPGYEFRQLLAPDVFTCSDATVPSGQPAQCSRILLAQVEYRADFTLRMFARDAAKGEAPGYRVTKTLSWVLFADGGRGWVTGPAEAGVSYGPWTLPPLYTFRSDAGAGFDLGWLGGYVAKSLSDWQTPVQFVVRLQHRF